MPPVIKMAFQTAAATNVLGEQENLTRAFHDRWPFSGIQLPSPPTLPVTHHPSSNALSAISSKVYAYVCLLMGVAGIHNKEIIA